MRWLLVKDLQILRRSKMLVGLLIAYPIAIALLIGLALSSAPTKPRVAFVDEIPPGQSTIALGSTKLDLSSYTRKLFTAVTEVPLASRQQALGEVRSGAVLAALIIPPDFLIKLSGAGFDVSPTVEVVYNGDALKQSFVRSTVTAALAQANAGLAEQLDQVAGGYIETIADGGTITALGLQFKLLGIKDTLSAVDRVLADRPSPATRRTLAPVQSFMSIGATNFIRFKDVLSAVERPVGETDTVLSGRRAPLDTFAVAVAVTVSLMFVCVLLASGLIALEREENTFARLTRGLIAPGRLLAAKVALAAACAAPVAFVMLAGVSVFVPLDWARVGEWIAALVGGALAFAALGVAIGSLAREVRAASLLAFLLSLPLAFLALVPSGSVAPGIYHAIRAISAIFPFAPALEAVNAAINDTSPSLGVALAHLAGLVVLFGAAARLGLRRLR
ncbi:MAG TPA: ABC transporter permease [Solirubrobacteraceae bacterium]|nr:ABC transporter permease [Solirubrobacteraceae bacterium]